MPFCPGCAKENAEGTLCPTCGTTIPSLSATNPSRSAKPRTAPIFAIVGAIAVVVYFLGRGAASSDANAAPTLRSDVLSTTRSLTEQIATGGSQCSPRDFKISKLRGTEEYSYISIVGIVKNTCSDAAAPQLKISIYDGKDNLLDTHEMWPASVSNIAPGDSFEWKDMMQAKSGWKKYSVRVMSVTRW